MLVSEVQGGMGNRLYLRRLSNLLFGTICTVCGGPDRLELCARRVASFVRQD